MKKYYAVLVATILLVLVCASILHLNSNLYYANMLQKAIVQKDQNDIVEILEKKPNCINTYPTLSPQWWQELMLQSVEYPLVEACRTGDVEIVKLLIQKGASINLGKNFTPLSVTYFEKPENWEKISEILIENGASLDYNSFFSSGNVLTDILGTRSGAVRDKYGTEDKEQVMRAFFYAIKKCDSDKIEWVRVLQHAVTNDRHEAVSFLINEHYCDVNDMSIGMTALMFAARDSDLSMVQLLVGFGADPSIVTKEGKTALDYAKQYGDDMVVAFLQGLNGDS